MARLVLQNASLLDGDPLADITVLQDRSKILAVFKGGVAGTSRSLPV